MGHKVFANGHEIVAKAGNSKTIANFPDVCFSPPSPAKVGVPIPYPNTAFAKDTTNGSRTVFIHKKPIMQRDKSFLKVSAGNKPATQGFKKGAVTGVIKGKCYFHLRQGSGKGPYRGGAHGKTSKPKNDGKDSHHMPADDVSPLKRSDGPAIQMDPADHRRTASNGNQGLKGVQYRKKIEDLLQQKNGVKPC